MTPSPWILRWGHLLAPGSRVLDIACGNGRHVRWLSAQQMQVTALDRDAAALAALEPVARTVVADIEAGPWPLADERFDAVVVTNYLWRPLMPQVLASVAEGGFLLYETFAHGQASVGRPARADFLLQPGELLRTLPTSFRVLGYEDVFLADPDRFVQRIVAVREAVPAAQLVAPPRYQGPALTQPAIGPALCRPVSRITRDHRTRHMTPIRGSIVAIVTPMQADGRVDFHALRRLIDWHIAEGTACVGVVGTTGESPTLSVEEHWQVIRVAVEHAAGRVPIMAGTGANSTAEAIEHSRYAKKVGADCTLSVVPYYNKPSQEGIFQHFKAIAEASDIPMVLYNVPGRTVADLQPETTLRLAELPGVIGIKEATGNIERACWLIKHAPKHFSVYSGDDGTAVALMLLGGHGNVSVTANVAPRAMAQLCAAAMAGDAPLAQSLHFKLLALHKLLFAEPSPAPAKWALQRLGRCEQALRLPILPISAALQAQLESAMVEAGLI